MPATPAKANHDRALLIDELSVRQSGLMLR
jgi:hypothetical protein